MPSVSLIALIAAGQGGIPRYAVALSRSFDEVAGEFPELQLRLVAHPPALERIAPRTIPTQFGRSLSKVGAGGGIERIAIEQACAVAVARSDYLFFFDLTLPLAMPRRRFVATVHDAAIARNFARETVWHKRYIQPAAARHASKLIAVSQFAKDEAVTFFGADPQRIAVVHSGPGFAVAGRPPAPDSIPAPATADRSAPSSAAASELPYFLHVGSLLSHKNLLFLVRAFAKLPASVRLVLVGSFGTDLELLQTEISKLGASERITIKTAVGDRELDALYRDARALAVPSLYEGFGFTLLEAFSRDCPVIASDIPAHREVAGDAALLIPPNDETAWVDALTRMLSDTTLAAKLTKNGKDVAARYSWTRTAREICTVLSTLPRRGQS